MYPEMAGNSTMAKPAHKGKLTSISIDFASDGGYTFRCHYEMGPSSLHVAKSKEDLLSLVRAKLSKRED